MTPLILINPSVVCRYPGRDTCLCRYHMEFNHYYNALRKFKSEARRILPEEVRPGLVPCPGSAQELRVCLNCDKDGEYYKPACCSRKCAECKGSLEALVSDAEKAAVPRVKYQKWSVVQYVCKDNRVIDNHDFLPAEVSIEEFISEFDEFLTTFMPHHNGAKWLDNDWSATWKNVSQADELLGARADGLSHWWELPEEEWLNLKTANQFATVMDYANSYQTEHKEEHMQQFW